MTPDTLTIKWNKDGQFQGASMRTLEGELVPVGRKGISIGDIMEQLDKEQLVTLITHAQLQLDTIEAGAPPKKPWYKRMLGK